MSVEEALPPVQGNRDAVPSGASGERSLAETGMLVDSGMRAKRVSPESVGGERLPASVGPSGGRARRRVLAGVGLALVVAVVVVIATDPFGGLGKSTGSIADNASAISLTSVKRQSLSQQTQVSGMLGYAGSSNIRVPSGTAPSAVQQASQLLASAETVLASAGATLASDTQALAGHQATLAAARAKVTADRSQVSSAEKQLANARSNLSTARSSAALYGQGSTFTALPSVGQIIRRGQSLYQISGQPVLLLYGSVLPTRAFIAGMSAGSDIAELNANLDALGYGQGLAGEEFTAATATAIRALQSAHGASATGELLLGSVVFHPGPVRVTSVTPTVGQAVMPGPVLAITSTVRQVKLALNAAEQGSVKVGDTVTITLPDNQTTPGRITYVSSVATVPSSSGHGGEEESSPTVEVDATPTDPATTGHLDQAPVNVEITTERVENVLAVPVDALLALAGGGYAVEVAEGRVHRLVAVAVGLFDDAEGVVQVSGQGLSAGQRVVVPATS
jgi:multidrug efflux pump subunit AcrA (membrane-fusion protein)